MGGCNRHCGGGSKEVQGAGTGASTHTCCATGQEVAIEVDLGVLGQAATAAWPVMGALLSVGFGSDDCRLVLSIKQWRPPALHAFLHADLSASP